MTIDRNKLAPCGYCRRCAIHDDPGGCLTVEAYVQELVEPLEAQYESFALIPDQRWGATVQGQFDAACTMLREAYDTLVVPEYDRIVL